MICDEFAIEFHFSSGYGGGFNDRQDIEYVKRDLDDEFDEFGRKKKRKEEVRCTFDVATLNYSFHRIWKTNNCSLFRQMQCLLRAGKFMRLERYLP